MPLRPLQFSELFDVTVNAAVRRFWTLAGLVLLVAVPVRLAEVAILAATVSNADDITSRSRTPTNGAVGVNLTVGLLGALVLVIGTALCFKVASAAYIGSRADVRSSAEFAAPRVGAVVWLAIVAGIGIVGGLLAFVIPGIWLAVAWSVSIPALLFEGLGPVRALGRSFELVRGRWWATFGALLVAILISGVASGLIQTGFDALLRTGLGDHVLWAALLDATGRTVASAVALPIQAVMVAVLYYDLRARKERIDTELLARRLDLEAGTVEAPKAAVPSLDAPARVPGAPPAGEEPGSWEPPTPPADVTPPSEWAPPRPPGVEDPER